MPTDHIIAIVPAPEHEHLIAEGPMGERPATLYGTSAGWFRPGHLNEHRIPDGRKALVLYAPGDPKLGMVRAMEAVFGAKQPISVHAEASRHPSTGWRGFALRPDSGAGDGVFAPRDPVWSVPPPADGLSVAVALPAYALAHLALQRGIASEVVVMPVEAMTAPTAQR